MKMEKLPIRIGHGFDVHKFSEAPRQGASIMLCGCELPHDRTLLAHSDGDVALHAVSDAMLGAIAAGDIGHHFPDTDAQYKNADSKQLLTHVSNLVQEKGYQTGNLDITIIAQAPRIAPYIQQMRESVAAVLGADIDAINVKATTTEALGYIGRQEGIAVHAVVILYRKD